MNHESHLRDASHAQLAAEHRAKADEVEEWRRKAEEAVTQLQASEAEQSAYLQRAEEQLRSLRGRAQSAPLAELDGLLVHEVRLEARLAEVLSRNLADMAC